MPAGSSVAFGSLTCPSCGAALPPHALEAAKDELCPRCRVALSGRLFPAWSARNPDPVTGSERALQGEAVCFFHPTNRAALPCDVCGRFVCTICDMPIGSRHLCPVCLSSGLGKEKLPEIIPRRFLWAWASFWFGLVPLVASVFLWWGLFITGTVAIVIALVGWKRPGSLVRGPQRWPAVVGVLLGVAQIGVSIGVYSLIAATWKR